MPISKGFHRASPKLPEFLAELSAPRFRRNVIWTARIRYIVIISVWFFALIGYIQGVFSFSMLPFHIIAAVGISANTFLYFYLLRPAAYKKVEDYSRIIWIALSSLIVDILAITAIVYFSGYLYSPFIILYVVALLGISIFLNLPLAGWSLLGVASLFIAGITLLPKASQFPGLVMLEPSPSLAIFSLAFFAACIGLMVFMGSFASNEVKFKTEELAETNMELQQVIRQLEGLNDEKKQILVGISHDLRNPLTSVRGFSEMLLKKAKVDSESKYFLEIINNESQRLGRLFDDILDISRQEEGTLRWYMEVHDVLSIMEPAIASARPAVEAKGLSLKVNIPSSLPPVYGDKERLSRVVTNLLSNAVRFTSAGMISITAEEKDKNILIQVSDTGIGISKEDQAKLFKPFGRAAEQYEGMGLGLYICKTIVDHHGGKIWVESVPGEGSTFYFTLLVLGESKVLTQPKEKL
jgi:signal transduction histidine kinase